MRIELRTLKPNPLRDFKVDPIGAANVEELRKSIKEDGFWGGVVARRYNGHYEIACGHHRVEAALKAGIREADIFVLDRDNADDATMVRVYARENATQRGTTTTAATGTVAAAVRFLVKLILTGDDEDVRQICLTSQKGLETLRGQLGSDKGLGYDVITHFLDSVPGCNESTVKTHLASLKASGDYARIVSEVREAIEEEHQAAVKELEASNRARAKAEAERAKAEADRKAANERAKEARDKADREKARNEALAAEARAKLADKRKAELEAEHAKIKGGAAVEAARKADDAAAQREVTFDLAGVAKHFQNDNQVRVFRDCVTGAGITPYLAVNQQAGLAKAIVAYAKEIGHELSGAFIREHVIDMVLRVKTKERAYSKEEKDALRNKDFESKFAGALEDFCRNVRGMNAAGAEILHLIKTKPQGAHLRITGEFRSNLSTAKNVILKLGKEF